MHDNFNYFLFSVCGRWKAMFKQFWAMLDLKMTYMPSKKPSNGVDKLDMEEFNRLLEIGGRYLKSLNLCAFDIPSVLKAKINANHYEISGKFDVYDFLKVIGNVCTKIEFFECRLPRPILCYAMTVPAFSTEIKKLIIKNRKIKYYKMFVKEAHANFFQLKGLPESVTEIWMNFCAADVPTLLNVSQHTHFLPLSSYCFSCFIYGWRSSRGAFSIIK